MGYPQKKGTVNYYHHSIYKLLVVNLGTRRESAGSAKKKPPSTLLCKRVSSTTLTARPCVVPPFQRQPINCRVLETNFGVGTATAYDDANDVGQPSAACRPGHCSMNTIGSQKKRPTPAWPAILQTQRRRQDRLIPPAHCRIRSKIALTPHTPPGSVDKPMNIHRIECAELPRCTHADFLSSFAPVQKQGLFSELKRT